MEIQKYTTIYQKNKRLHNINILIRMLAITI
jgi:hypothetical protein